MTRANPVVHFTLLHILLFEMHKNLAAKFTLLTSSPHTFPSLYQQTVQTQGWHFGVKEEGVQGRTEECRWIGIRTKGTEEQQVPTRPSPLSWLCSCIFFATIQKQLAQIRPMGWENRPTCTKLLSLRQPSAEEREERDTGYATCSSRRIGHGGPDVPLQCSLLSLINALGFALQHIPTSPCLCSQLNFKAWWSYLMWSTYRYRINALFSAPCSH